MDFSNRRGSSTYRARQSGCDISGEGKKDEPGMSPIIRLNWTYPLIPFPKSLLAPLLTAK